ncbi:MAG: alpha/beta hydrolase fold protein [Myxococcales bacterium]|nr:alpha/beta hydrolase fold protein [Myxococcales bacterium]
MIISIQAQFGVTCQCAQRCDNRSAVAAGDPFELVGDGELGVVCVHGFTGTPYEMRFLGDQLGRAGFTVHGLRLPGHGTRLSDLDLTTWTDWAAAVEDAFDTMRMLCGRVAIVGQSLGGLLALHLASQRPEVAAVASLAAPIWLDGLGGRVAKWAASGALKLATLPKLRGSDVRDRSVRDANPSYDKIPVRALGELAKFMMVAEAALPQITQPVLVLHAKRDHTAPVACATRIAERTRAVRVRILERSYHLISTDVERDIVAAEVIQFLRRHAMAKPSRPIGDLACAT